MTETVPCTGLGCKGHRCGSAVGVRGDTFNCRRNCILVGDRTGLFLGSQESRRPPGGEQHHGDTFPSKSSAFPFLVLVLVKRARWHCRRPSCFLILLCLVTHHQLTVTSFRLPTQRPTKCGLGRRRAPVWCPCDIPQATVGPGADGT